MRYMNEALDGNHANNSASGLNAEDDDDDEDEEDE